MALLVGTGVLYLWGLGASGWANSFYSAAAQAGSESWKAFFFGSSDAGNSITVDKTPLALWPMALSIRIFGLSSWSILVPQALFGIASVALLHRVVRRTTGSVPAALLAGITLALTPVAVLMFRFNNPDALLVLLLIGSVAATLRAIEESGRAEGRPVRWVALGGALVGLAFLAKMLQAFLVLPPLALAYLLFAQRGWGRRVADLLIAFGSMVLAGGWWVAIVELWPASSRPWIGGSQNNSILELTLGYNGLGRLNGEEVGSVGGGGAGGGSQWGTTGLLRMFSSDIGGQVAWLLPAALILGAATLWLGRERLLRAATTLWLGWLVVTGLTFSLMAGIFHPYYTVALAPAIAALVGAGAVTAWQRRNSIVATGVLAGSMALTTLLAFGLLGRTADFVGWLRWVVLIVGLVAAVGLALHRLLPRRIALAVAGLAIVAALAGPAAYAVDTAATPHTGSIPSAGPSGQGGFGPGGGRGRFGAGMTPPGQTQRQAQGLTPGQTPGQTPGRTQAGGQTRPMGGGMGGGMGGLLDASTPSAELTALLRTNADDYTWVAAAVGSQSAAGYQLATESPVMPIGGFNGSDPSPTLAQFQAMVAAGDIHYFIAGGGFGGGQGGSGAGSSINEWVQQNFTSTTVDGVTLYDLSAANTQAES